MSSTAIALIIISYFILLLVISRLTGRDDSNESFFTGRHQSPWYVVAFGMIGASLSGVTFISVPGWVEGTQLTYMQMVFGYFLGYLFIAHVLLPVYYRLKLTSIYTYLDGRFGYFSYKTGAGFFLLSRTVGAAARLFLVSSVLQLTMFNEWGVPFWVTVVVTILLIWLYTFRGGIRTIIWTDTLQTFFMLAALVLTMIQVYNHLDMSPNELMDSINANGWGKMFEFDDWKSRQNFFKQFLSGAFITIVMTGLDQDMMQKNLTCRNLREAQKNMHWYGFCFVPVNFLFLILGAMLLVFAQKEGLTLPQRTDEIYPLIATKGFLSPMVAIFFIIGLIAAAYSSADSALTSLTTSFTIDILNIKELPEKEGKKLRIKIHFLFSVLLALIILVFHYFNAGTIINTIFTIAGFTYGPLLGLYCFGLFTLYKLKDQWVPLVALLAPVVCGILYFNSQRWFGFTFGFEILMVNGFITFLGLWLIRVRGEKIEKKRVEEAKG